uniref:Uncharacterized protein n=1 Tax=Pavo cristatus TaxID=9049 RepID=A0A8C9FB58_PAVCR
MGMWCSSDDSLHFEFVTVLVRDPRTQKEDSWHSYIDYEIFIHVSIKISPEILWTCTIASVRVGAYFRY